MVNTRISCQPLHILLFCFLLAVASCQKVASTIMNVEIGEVPQQVSDVYVPSPEGIEVEVWQQHLDIPWGLVFLPNGDALVSERSGSIRLIRDGKLQEQAYATFEHVDHERGDEAGLMDMALHPNFENQPYVYVYYTHREGDTRDNRIVRLRHSGTQGVFDRVILQGIPAADKHNAGPLKFGPDGMLYLPTGENFEREMAQDMGSLGGKFLRLTPEGEVPADNPFPNSPIYTLGHRNPQGFDWHPQTGDLFSSEHGPSGEILLFGRDIINVIHPGKNYGWPRVLGAVNMAEYEDPIIMWEEATPPAGVAFWQGDLYVATLRSETLIRISMEQKNGEYNIQRIERWFSPAKNEGHYGRLRNVVAGPDGALYVLTSNRDGRGDPVAADDRILRITRTP